MRIKRNAGALNGWCCFINNPALLTAPSYLYAFLLMLNVALSLVWRNTRTYITAHAQRLWLGDCWLCRLPLNTAMLRTPWDIAKRTCIFVHVVMVIVYLPTTKCRARVRGPLTPSFMLLWLFGSAITLQEENRFWNTGSMRGRRCIRAQ